MGNRGGAIHDGQCRIVRPFHNRRWIACVLEFRGRRRQVMSPGRYTELFFLDEAVALAAGHRPCAECRRERFNAFKRAWKADGPILAPEIDAELHRARIDLQGRKITWSASLETLPEGCFLQLEDSAYLLWRKNLLLWMPEGYASKQSMPRGLTVAVLTPRPIVECLRRGYQPQIHDSAFAL